MVDLTREQCKELKELGLEQGIKQGEYYYSHGNPDEPPTLYCGVGRLQFNAYTTRIPTITELKKFAWGLAEKYWGAIDYDNQPQLILAEWCPYIGGKHDVAIMNTITNTVCTYNDIMLVGYGDTEPLALYELIKKIVEARDD